MATNLGRWGMPLIRYRTGDRVNVSRALRELIGKFGYMTNKFRNLAHLDRLMFVISNTQNANQTVPYTLEVYEGPP